MQRRGRVGRGLPWALAIVAGSYVLARLASGSVLAGVPFLALALPALPAALLVEGSSLGFLDAQVATLLAGLGVEALILAWFIGGASTTRKQLFRTALTTVVLVFGGYVVLALIVVLTALGMPY